MATAGHLRCSLSRSNLSISLRHPANPFFHRTAGVVCVLCRKEQNCMFATHVSMQRQLLLGYQRSGFRILSTVSKEGHPFCSLSDIRQHLSNSCHGDMEHLNDHEIHMSLSLLKALLVSSVSMMILPSRSLAETCAPNNSLFNMPILFSIALIGAAVGGLLARQRKGELKKLNDQLRQINAALRRQAKIESYVPNLSYIPGNRVSESEIIVDPGKEELINLLRAGKNYLRNQEPDKAFVEFQKAFKLAEAIEDYMEQKKAARGLGTSLQRQGKFREAIKYHSKVLEIARQSGKESGSSEAYGAIADCYTELGDLERAGKFYDRYIAKLETD